MDLKARMLITFFAMAMACQAVAVEQPTLDDPVHALMQSMPDYRPAARAGGVVRLWGHGSFKHDFMKRLVDRWSSEFRVHHPDVEIRYQMYGTASAVGAVYTGAGDIALLGEEISPAAARAFQRAKGYAHTDITVATGSVDVNFFDYAHMIFVHADNPLEQLSLPQLRRIFGHESGAGADNLRAWGQLGLQGKWTQKPIQPYGWKTDTDFALFFRERVLEGSHRFNPAIREYVHLRDGSGAQYDHGQQILDALAKDPSGIAISNVRYARPGVKPIALAWRDQGPFVHATTETLIQGDYPLVRWIPAIVDLPPGGSLPAPVREFMLYLLSRQGQLALIAESSYLPLSSERLLRERGKIQ